MNQHCQDLDAFLRKLPLDAFWQHVTDLTAMRDVAPCVIEGLESAWRANDLALVERYILTASIFPSAELAPLMVEILIARPRGLQLEDIVEILELIKDPCTVPTLVDAVNWTFPWDDYKHFARKCLSALAAIGTPESMDAIEQIATGASEPLRTYAREILAQHLPDEDST